MGNHRRLQPEEVLCQGPVGPVLLIHRTGQARPLAKALPAGGIRVLEITLRTPIALEAIQIIRFELCDVLVGAGTVTTRSPTWQTTRSI